VKNGGPIALNTFVKKVGREVDKVFFYSKDYTNKT